ncbi:MAG: helix-hairpin-helix domain-containing protein [Prevotellaceae bacterium]|jgi:hypothetical protein|nr:helix-hairpin-helix domain-containing protein [Prevotellaceae bacterium]
MKHFAFILLMLMICVENHAQESEIDPMKIIIDMVEEVATSNEDENAEIDLEQIYEQFANLLNNPVDLNSATRADLEQLYILSDFQIFSVLEYIKSNGKMLSKYELAFVYGFDSRIAESLYPFVTVASGSEYSRISDTAKLKDMIGRGRHQIIARAKQLVEKQAGYKDDATTKFQGSPLSLYVRYTFQYADRLKWNITTEKDAGEKYLDFISGHVQYDSKKFLKRLIVGDFQAQFGQGLVLWNGFGLNKSATGTAVRKRARGIYGYSSTDENKYFRGAAANMEAGKFNISIFASYKNRDATTADSTDKIFTTLQTTGLHRTNSEINNKNSVSETALGGNINYEHKNLRAGITAIWHKFGADYVRNIQPYNMFELNKSSNYNYSADVQWMWKRMILFAETAFDANMKHAGIMGATFGLEQNIQLSLLYRNYARDYQSLYAQGFTDGIKTGNEDGFFIMTTFSPLRNMNFSGYFDIFTFPWLKYRTNAPSEGYSYAFRIDYSPSHDIKMYVNVKQKSSKENYTPADEHIAKTVNKYIFRVNYNINYTLFGKLMLQNRIEYATFKRMNETGENGFMIFQDAAYRFTQFPLNVSLRYAYFNTDSWNTCIYTYESDMLYAYSVPAYYMKGQRFYLNLQYSLTKRIKLWMKASQTIYKNRESISSGTAKIDGNKQTEIKAQIIIKL